MNKKWNTYFIGLFFSLSAVLPLSCSAKASELVLVDGRQGNTTIIISKGCGNTEKFAAKQLQFYIKKMTGSSWAIKDDTQKPHSSTSLQG